MQEIKHLMHIRIRDRDQSSHAHKNQIPNKGEKGKGTVKKPYKSRKMVGAVEQSHLL
jgi:hypothetical protein